MHYYPILDAAPSSVSSTAVSLAGSLFSLLGSIYVMISLNMLRKNTDADARKTWQSRHYLIFALACVNFVMSSSALISGSFFLVYGRISSAVGCTIGGMIEFWAQQADNACIIFIALVVMLRCLSRRCGHSDATGCKSMQPPLSVL
ncbi:hypothetical protein BX070DRAFT_42855 [Coemansia spiralis]|nr:hypothetical protein BX070DRAFT_42855 [Coemansia spiralis]